MVALTSFSAAFNPTRRASDRIAAAKTSRDEAQHDASLVSRCRAGDDTAFPEIIARYQERMFAVAFAQLHSYADAEEIAQDTFIRAHRGIANFRGDSSLSTWLYRITVNLARNRYWHLFRRQRHMTISLDCPLHADQRGTFTDLVAAADPDPSSQATVNELNALVTASMRQLDVAQREILTLRNVLHQSYASIAETLGINVGTVKSRIARARGKLRGFLAEACPEFGAETDASTWSEPLRRGGL